MSDGAHASRGLLDELGAALDELEATESRGPAIADALDVATAQIERLAQRTQTLERRLRHANALAAAAHEQLLAERAWVAEQARAVAASRSWRVGHGLVRAARSLVRRHDHGADGLTMILRRMDQTAAAAEPVDGPRRA